jgi:hypothetical protein
VLALSGRQNSWRDHKRHRRRRGKRAIENEELRNLGLVTHWSALMAYPLRESFCSLIGSKYAAVVAGGRSTEWLIQNCRAIVKVHREMEPEHRTAILNALTDCERAKSRRNTAVHGMQTANRPSDGMMHTMRSRPGKHTPEWEPWMPQELPRRAEALVKAREALVHAAANAGR